MAYLYHVLMRAPVGEELLTTHPAQKVKENHKEIIYRIRKDIPYGILYRDDTSNEISYSLCNSNIKDSFDLVKGIEIAKSRLDTTEGKIKIPRKIPRKDLNFFIKRCNGYFRH